MSDAPGSARGSRLPGDSSSNVVDEELFRFLVRLEVNKASRLQYTVSVVCVAPSEEENSCGLASTDSTSVCRSTSQNPGPAGQPRTGVSATQATGVSVRSRASASKGTPST